LQVSICDINTEVGEQLVQQFSVKYGKDKVIFCQCDVTDYPQYEGMPSKE
jgi:15-hydroxyprostaglandin dehydrogenase (NAD)